MRSIMAEKEPDGFQLHLASSPRLERSWSSFETNAMHAEIEKKDR
jgi:hypothetical protein